MANEASVEALTVEAENDTSLLDILDHVLNSGAVIHGSLVISLAGVDLVYVGLNVILTSVETALRNRSPVERAFRPASSRPQ
jgi:gas vesicle structural protein